MRFAFRVTEGVGANRFLPLSIPGLTGEIRACAVRGADLHAVFADGSHWRFAPALPGWHTVTPPIRFAEVNLPQSAVPVAMTGDADGQALFALLRSSPTDQKSAADTPNQSGSILRYAEGAWTVARYAPEVLPSNVRFVSLTVREDEIHILYRSDAKADALLHQISGGVNQRWSDPASVPADAPIRAWTTAWVDSRLTILAAIGSGDATTFRLFVFEEGVWRKGPRLPDDRGAIAQASGPNAIAFFGALAVVAAFGPDRTPVVATWSASNDQMIEPWTPVSPVFTPGEPRAGRVLRQMIQYAVLALMLMLVFLRKRDTVMALAKLPPPLSQARLGRRFGALLADLAITLPLWTPALYALYRTGGRGMTFAEQISLGPQGVPSAFTFWGWSVIGLVLALYSAIGEGLTRTTPGKRIFRCLVAGEPGTPCGLGAILLRNLLRVVEFHFPALMLLVVMTPNRQRLGDLLARTIVTEISSRPPESSRNRAAGSNDEHASS